jgi:hypothetical protein
MLVKELLAELQNVDPNAVVVAIKSRHKHQSLRHIREHFNSVWEHVTVDGQENGYPRRFLVLSLHTDAIEIG